MVSGALDRLHQEADACVRYDSERKLWIYLHAQRTVADLQPKAPPRLAPPPPGATKPAVAASALLPAPAPVIVEPPPKEEEEEEEAAAPAAPVWRGLH